MSFEKDEDLSIKFLKALCRIKGWSYQDKIESEKKAEIKEFIAEYVFKNIFSGKISYNRLIFLVNHPSFKPSFKAILTLLELSGNEKEFKERYQKVNIKPASE